MNELNEMNKFVFFFFEKRIIAGVNLRTQFVLHVQSIIRTYDTKIPMDPCACGMF